MKTEANIRSYDGWQLFTSRDIPEAPKAVAVVVHGLCEHLGRYEYLTGKLNGAGIAVYRFDHRGHGKSDGERAFLENFNCLVDDTDFVLELAKKEHPGLPVYVIGHSMGGFTGACYGAKYPGKAAGIVLSGALTHDEGGLLSQLPKGLDPHTAFPNELGDGVCRDPAVCKAYEDDPLRCRTFSAGLAYAMQSGIEWLKEKHTDFSDPVLMLHGECDKLVSYRDSCEFFSEVSSEDKQLKIYGKCYHEIFNEYGKDEVIGDVLRWIANRL